VRTARRIVSGTDGMTRTCSCGRSISSSSTTTTSEAIRWPCEGHAPRSGGTSNAGYRNAARGSASLLPTHRQPRNDPHARGPRGMRTMRLVTDNSKNQPPWPRSPRLISRRPKPFAAARRLSVSRKFSTCQRSQRATPDLPSQRRDRNHQHVLQAMN
jgi:hypothetical protein